MCERVADVVGSLRAIVAGLSPSSLSPTEAAGLVEQFATIERIASAGRTLALSPVASSTLWRDAGYRTPATWAASVTGSTLGAAITSVGTAGLLGQRASTRQAFASGELSEVQASEVALAATADPSSEAGLIAFASANTVGALRERCAQVRAAAASDEDATERIRRSRYLRHWTDREGAVRLEGRLAPDEGARLLGALTARADTLAQAARRSGQYESLRAYRADALVDLACGDAFSRAVVHVRVDAAALARGRTLAGETCAIPGVGPVSVLTARRFAESGFVKVIGTNGVDVTRVAHLGRQIPAHLRTALEERDPTCVVPGCDLTRGLEVDHIIPYDEGGPTRLSNLARLCRYHHGQKTHHGWWLSGGPGAWRWEPQRPRARAP